MWFGAVRSAVWRGVVLCVVWCDANCARLVWRRGACPGAVCGIYVQCGVALCGANQAFNFDQMCGAVRMQGDPLTTSTTLHRAPIANAALRTVASTSTA